MAASIVALVCLSLCLPVVFCQSDKLSSGNNVVRLLVRKVDETHPYFNSMNFQRPQNASETLANLTRMIIMHCNTSNITRLVKNDLLLVKTNDDANSLESGDRIEVWSNSSGPATRADTAKSFASFQVRQMCNSSCSAGQGSGASGGRGESKRNRKRRKQEEDDDDRFFY